MVTRRVFIFLLLLGLTLAGCSAIDRMAWETPAAEPSVSSPQSNLASVCPVTEPTWAKPPEDPAVSGSPGYGYYYVNEDGSMWASAWWAEAEGYRLRAGKEGIKVGWFRPEGATLEIGGRRLDGQASALNAQVPCCYPTRFQATGLVFPAEGCWEITASAAESTLSFIVRVEPESEHTP